MKKLACLLLLIAMTLCASALADETVAIVLSDDGIQADAAGVEISGSMVKITRPGDYRVSGTLTNGQLSVDCRVEGKVTLYLDNAQIHNETGAAILIGKCSPRAVISLVDGSENVLSNGADLVFTDGDEPNAALFSKSDLTLSGTGKLTVTSGAMDAIVSKDDLIIKEGTYVIRAARHGIRGKDAVEIEDGDITIVAGKDGIKSTNDKEPDRGYVSITGGLIRITCGDDPLSCVTRMTIIDADITIEMQP